MNAFPHLKTLILCAVLSTSVSSHARTIEGDSLESATITLLDHSSERAWQVLEKVLDHYDVVSRNPSEFSIEIACARESKNSVLLSLYRPKMEDNVRPRTLIRILSACTPHEHVKIIDLQNDLLNAADAP